MSAIVIAIIAVALYGAGFGSAWKIEEWRYDAAEAAHVVAQAQAQAAADKRADEIADRFEKKLDNLKITNTTINRDVTHELQTRVYSDCKLPESGRVLLNTYADDVNSALGFAPVVSATPAAGKQPVDNGRSGGTEQNFDAAIRRLRDTAAVSAGVKSKAVPPTPK